MKLADCQTCPGYEIVSKGLADLAEGKDTMEAWLVTIARPRLRRSGLAIPKIRKYNSNEPSEHQLYKLLATEYGNGAHSKYNALINRMVSFARCIDMKKCQADDGSA